VAAVLLVSPTYHGAVSDIRSSVSLCHKYGVPLIVDEAHGSHLQFLEEGSLEGSLAMGADIVIHSIHKTLTALTQAAMLHIGR